MGHEWGHTLKEQNEALYDSLKHELPNYIKNYRQELKPIREQGYKYSALSEELTCNVIGDAFAHPEFWNHLSQKNRPLFHRVIAAVNRWFASFSKKAQHSEWGTEQFLSDLDKVHQAVMRTLEKAAEKGPYPEKVDDGGSP